MGGASGVALSTVEIIETNKRKFRFFLRINNSC